MASSARSKNSTSIGTVWPAVSATFAQLRTESCACQWSSPNRSTLSTRNHTPSSAATHGGATDTLFRPLPCAPQKSVAR